VSIRPGTTGIILSPTKWIGRKGSVALYFDDMLRRNKTFTRSMLLALMLVIGSVQAHASYFCSMMDTVIHDDCCCADSGIDDMAFTDREPCCEKSIELGIDAASDQVQTNIKPIKFESDVDPPTAGFCAIDYSFELGHVVAIIYLGQAEAIHSAGSTTYLITLRLRI